MVSLGFSVQAEHAHQNQVRLLLLCLLDQRTNINHEHGRGFSSSTKSGNAGQE